MSSGVTPSALNALWIHVKRSQYTYQNLCAVYGTQLSRYKLLYLAGRANMYMPKGRQKNTWEEKKMSRAQGDSYKTWTDHKLNAYKVRLDDKLHKLIDHKEKWYRAGKGWILAEEQNRMTNPNGSWKWNGWEIEAHEYWITVFPEECVTVKNGKPQAIGWAQVVKVIDDDKNAANTYFKNIAKPLATDLTTWIPMEADNGNFFDYEGRIPQAMITIGWEEDNPFFTLVIDGKEAARSTDRDELKAEAARLGAELEETHTP